MCQLRAGTCRATLSPPAAQHAHTIYVRGPATKPLLALERQPTPHPADLAPARTTDKDSRGKHACAWRRRLETNISNPQQFRNYFAAPLHTTLSAWPTRFYAAPQSSSPPSRTSAISSLPRPRHLWPCLFSGTASYGIMSVPFCRLSTKSGSVRSKPSIDTPGMSRRASATAASNFSTESTDGCVCRTCAMLSMARAKARTSNHRRKFR